MLEGIAVDKELKVLGVPLSVDADRGPLDKETGYLIEEIVKYILAMGASCIHPNDIPITSC